MSGVMDDRIRASLAERRRRARGTVPALVRPNPRLERLLALEAVDPGAVAALPAGERLALHRYKAAKAAAAG